MSKERIRVEADAGQTMAEYAVVLGVITIALVTTISLLSGTINGALLRTLEVLDFAF
jgi:Flp pilus assembly pilin Flp